MTAQNISRSDIEAKLQEIKGGVDSTADTAKPIALTAGVVVVVAVVGLVFLFGKRRGRKKTTVVEVRRV